MPSQYHCPRLTSIIYRHRFKNIPCLPSIIALLSTSVLRISHAFPVSLPCYRHCFKNIPCLPSIIALLSTYCFKNIPCLPSIIALLSTYCFKNISCLPVSLYYCPVIDIILRTSHAFPVSLPCYRLVLRISHAFPVSLPCYRHHFKNIPCLPSIIALLSTYCFKNIPCLPSIIALLPSQYHCLVIDIVLRTSHAFPVSLPCY